MKLTADTTGSERRFTAKLGGKERFEPEEMNVLFSNKIPMLIPPIAVHGRKNNVIQYDISEYSTLKFYLSTNLSREQLSELLLRCIDVFQRVSKISLNYKNLVLELDKVYIGLNDRSVHFIYLPLMASKREGSKADFFRTLLKKTVKNTTEQSILVDACLKWLDRPVYFNLSEFSTFIQEQISDARTPSVPSSNPVPPSPPVSPPHLGYPEPKKWQGDERFVPPMPGGRIQEGKEPDSGGTIQLGSEYESKLRFYLRRRQTDEMIELTHFPFLIGTAFGSVAYRISNNPAVSRQHAEFNLSADGKSVLITDKKSTNKTYVNDCAIVPFSEHKLNDGDTIRLGNECFRFIEKKG